MRRKKLLWQLYPWYLFITLACLLALSLYASEVFEGFFETAPSMFRVFYAVYLNFFCW